MGRGCLVKNTRRYKRYRLDYVEINGQLTLASEVSVLDISMGGVSLRVDKRLNIGGKYLLRLEDKEMRISVKCEVAWARLSGTKKSPGGEAIPEYTAGMKFIDLSEEKCADLMHFVECIEREEVRRADDRRQHVRFNIQMPGMAILNFPADYSVRTISLSGMLIESNQTLEPERRVPMVLSLHDNQSIDFLGRIVSCQRKVEESGECYQIGIEFIDVTSEAREVLASFIDLLQSLESA
jgi:c-di-GMP-binding flagellar brake protein YcgR